MFCLLFGLVADALRLPVRPAVAQHLRAGIITIIIIIMAIVVIVVIMIVLIVIVIVSMIIVILLVIVVMITVVRERTKLPYPCL